MVKNKRALIAASITLGALALPGISLIGDPQTNSVVGYLGDGSAYGVHREDTFSFAPIQLRHNAEIKRMDRHITWLLIINHGITTVPVGKVVNRFTIDTKNVNKQEELIDRVEDIERLFRTSYRERLKRHAVL